MRSCGFAKSESVYWKNLSERARGQIVVSANAYFVSLLCQVSFPSSVMELAPIVENWQASEMRSGFVYNPVFSADAICLLDDPLLRRALEDANWEVLRGEIPTLITSLMKAIDAAAKLEIPNGSTWWPQEFGRQQLVILLNELRRTGKIDMLKQVAGRYHVSEM
jgi:hypothetical protein